jgi:hypothetical protein
MDLLRKKRLLVCCHCHLLLHERIRKPAVTAIFLYVHCTSSSGKYSINVLLGFLEILKGLLSRLHQCITKTSPYITLKPTPNTPELSPLCSSGCSLICSWKEVKGPLGKIGPVQVILICKLFTYNI